MNDTAETKEKLLNKLVDLQREIEELKREKLQSDRLNKDITVQHDQLFSIFGNIKEHIYVADPETYEVLYVNGAVRNSFGDVVGRKCYQAFQKLEAPCPFCTNDRIFGENLGQTYIWEFQNQVNRRWYRCIDQAIPWPDGRMVRYEMAVDVTDYKRTEDIVAKQNQEILELSTPVIQIWPGIVIVPLIGTLDSQRTQIFMERFLNRIAETQSTAALVDITGVPTVDTQTAQHLIEAITAARLLGTQVILTGVRANIAQTLVHLGVDLSEIETHFSLIGGLKIALDMVGLEVIPKTAQGREEK